MTQIDVFSEAEASASRNGFPDGFATRLISFRLTTKWNSLARIRDLPFREFEFHGYKGKRRVVSIGWQHDFDACELRKANDIPDFLVELRDVAARFAGIPSCDLKHVLATKYGVSAQRSIGERAAVLGDIPHPVFGITLISLFEPPLGRRRAPTSPCRRCRG